MSIVFLKTIVKSAGTNLTAYLIYHVTQISSMDLTKIFILYRNHCVEATINRPLHLPHLYFFTSTRRILLYSSLQSSQIYLYLYLTSFCCEGNGLQCLGEPVFFNKSLNAWSPCLYPFPSI